MLTLAISSVTAGRDYRSDITSVKGLVWFGDDDAYLALTILLRAYKQTCLTVPLAAYSDSHRRVGYTCTAVPVNCRASDHWLRSPTFKRNNASRRCLLSARHILGWRWQEDALIMPVGHDCPSPMFQGHLSYGHNEFGVLYEYQQQAISPDPNINPWGQEGVSKVSIS